MLFAAACADRLCCGPHTKPHSEQEHGVVTRGAILNILTVFDVNCDLYGGVLQAIKPFLDHSTRVFMDSDVFMVVLICLLDRMDVVALENAPMMDIVLGLCVLVLKMYDDDDYYIEEYRLYSDCAYKVLVCLRFATFVDPRQVMAVKTFLQGDCIR